jgi:hypothetical protein
MYLRSRFNNSSVKNLACHLSAFLCLFICSCNNNDHVPDNINAKASLPYSVKLGTAGLKAITSFIDRKAGTMSTLYGNEPALRKATSLNQSMVRDALFTLVTWKQQPDEHWFGAGIPGDLQSVEILKTAPGGDSVVINYQRYQGKTLVLDTDTLHQSERMKFILSQRPSVMP